MKTKVSLLLGVILLFSTSSCDYIFNKTTPKTNVKNTSKPIDYSSIDAYPLLDECSHLTSRKEQQLCFYEMLSAQIESTLQTESITLYKTPKDTLQIKIVVNSKGVISVSSVNIDSTFKPLKNAIIKSIEKLPKVAPAIKSGIPINSVYTLPIVVMQKKKDTLNISN